MKKIDLSCDWIENSENQIFRHPIQGAVYQCQLGENIGNEQGEHRPVLIVSNNTMNSIQQTIFCTREIIHFYSMTLLSSLTKFAQLVKCV